MQFSRVRLTVQPQRIRIYVLIIIWFRVDGERVRAIWRSSIWAGEAHHRFGKCVCERHVYRRQIADENGDDDILNTDRYQGVHFTHGSPWYAMLQAVGLTKVLGILPMNNGHVLASESWVQLNHILLNYLFKFPTAWINDTSRGNQEIVGD